MSSSPPTTPTGKSIFITYAWVDNAEGNLDFIVQELERAGLNVRFDRRELVPGRRIWDQIAGVIADEDTDAWGYLVTRSSLTSERCREEYAYALQRALNSRGTDFPLIGLLHDVRAQELPSGLAIRLCVPLDDSNWMQQVIAGVEGRPPRPDPGYLAPVIVRWHRTADGRRVLELSPRIGSVRDWRIAVPLAYKSSLRSFGDGSSQRSSGSDVDHLLTTSFHTIDGENDRYRVVGAAGPIGHGVSAYLWFSGPIPDHVLIAGLGPTDYYLPLTQERGLIVRP